MCKTWIKTLKNKNYLSDSTKNNSTPFPINSIGLRGAGQPRAGPQDGGQDHPGDRPGGHRAPRAERESRRTKKKV